LKDFSSCRCTCVIDAGGDQRAASSHAFGIEICVVFRNPSVSERAHKTASRTSHDSPSHGTSGRSYQPARRNYWPDAWDCQEPEAGQKATDTTHCGANTSALPGVRTNVRRLILAITAVDVI
jgi:hypothetical protein